MNFPSILLWGFVATLALSMISETARGLGWSRMSLPFMLGTMFTANYDWAAPIGLLVHFAAGWVFALPYALVFESWHRATWWLGAGMGLVHGAAVLLVFLPLLPAIHPRMASEHFGPEPTSGLEPPGFLGLNYGRRTPLFAILGHLLYGAILGGGYRLLS